LHGQRNDAVVDWLPDGTPRILDGVSRMKILFQAERPLACRVITDGDLNGKSMEQWIITTNFAGDEGRQLTDTQRAIQVVELEDELQEVIKMAEERSRSGKKVDEAEKGTVAEHLARLANVKASRVQQVLDVKKKATSPDEFQKLTDLMWSGKCVVSKALKIVGLTDPQERSEALAAARDGDKVRLARALGAAPPRDAFQVTIPRDLLPIFASRAKVQVAIKQLEKAANCLRDASVEPRHIESATELVQQLKLSQPHAMCEHCNFTGRDEQNQPCSRCKSKRYLTLREFETARAKELKKIPHVK
jgi:hypothetical protein